MNKVPQSTRFSCLLLDDDPGFSSLLARLVREEGGDPVLCASVAQAEAVIASRCFDLAVLDNRLGDGTGYDFHPRLRRRCPGTVVMMITGAPELSQAVELTRNGLFDYLTKPLAAGDFVASIRRARLRISVPESDGTGEFVGTAETFQEIQRTLRQAAAHREATVLLLGETGTGKDMAARRLHQLTFGAHAESMPYVAVNCSAVPADMFEAELFGSERGAYTGADRRRPGLIEAAQGGTLFLDEVAEIPLPLQAKLLRFLENRDYRPLGSTGSRTFSGRVVAATNRSLDDEVKSGRLREDLRFRLDVLSLRLPPLRERPDDVPALAESLLSQLCHKYGRRPPLLRPSDLLALRGYRFPGNVRELRNLLERSLLKSPTEAQWLPLDLGWLGGVPAAGASPTPTPVSLPVIVNAETALPHPEPAVDPAGRALPPIEAAEYQLIVEALRAEAGGIRRAATRLGLTHQALLRRLQKWPELRRIAQS